MIAEDIIALCVQCAGISDTAGKVTRVHHLSIQGRIIQLVLPTCLLDTNLAGTGDELIHNEILDSDTGFRVNFPFGHFYHPFPKNSVSAAECCVAPMGPTLLYEAVGSDARSRGAHGSALSNLLCTAFAVGSNQLSVTEAHFTVVRETKLSISPAEALTMTNS